MAHIYLLIATCLLANLTIVAQKHQINYQAEFGAGTAAKPFWLHTNSKNKIAPDTYMWGNISFISDFVKQNTRLIDYSIGIEGTGALGQYHNRIFFNQLFGKIRWQNLTLNVGLFDRPTLYDGLSASNGDMLYSNNSRNMAGISFASWDYIRFPWILGRFIAFKFKYAEHMMLDKRHVTHTHVHNKLLAGKLTIIPQLSIEGGIEDYGQWGGKTTNGKICYTFNDYIKMICIKAGGENASLSDQINKLGNHLGRHFARINYEGKHIRISLYYNHIFEDGSGRKYQNKPDGLYGIYFTRKDKEQWFKSLVYEFYYTKDQSGPHHDRPATEEEIADKDPSDPFPDKIVLGGNDNYLNHGEYRSGWSLYGQIIGLPFFTPTKAINGIINGSYNTRFIAHHIGINGILPLMDIEYKLMCSYSLNYGQYSAPFLDKEGKTTNKPQFSFGLQFTVPEKQIPFTTSLNIGFDKGELLDNRFGIILNIIKIGVFKYRTIKKA